MHRNLPRNLPAFASEPLLGYRWWKIVGWEPRLHPVAVSEAWPPGQAEHAQCDNSFSRKKLGPPHEAPAAGCMCGIWAFKTPGPVIESLGRYRAQLPFVIGEVKLWGRVFEHTKGYRAEWAYPSKLEINYWINTKDEAEALALALVDAYRVPTLLQQYGDEKKSDNPPVETLYPWSKMR